MTDRYIALVADRERRRARRELRREVDMVRVGLGLPTLAEVERDQLAEAFRRLGQACVNAFRPAAVQLARALGQLQRTAPVITLCGSTKFKADFMAENQRLTMEGNVVISLGVFGHTDLPDYDWTTDASDLKRTLDGLHFQKIRMADRVHVVDPGGYVGESTAREIAYAESLGKPVTYMSTAKNDECPNDHGADGIVPCWSPGGPCPAGRTVCETCGPCYHCRPGEHPLGSDD